MHFSFRCLQGAHDSGILLRFRTTLNCALSGDAPLFEDVDEGGVGWCCEGIFENVGGHKINQYLCASPLCSQAIGSSDLKLQWCVNIVLAIATRCLSGTQLSRLLA